MNWNLRDDLPIYSQLIYQIKSAIASGELAPGARLQSVRDMAIEAKVNPNTMQRAMSELEREGIVFSQRTSGRFVTEDYLMLNDLKASLAGEHVETFFKAMAGIGYDKAEAIRLLEEYEEEKDNGNS